MIALTDSKEQVYAKHISPVHAFERLRMVDSRLITKIGRCEYIARRMCVAHKPGAGGKAWLNKQC